MSTPTTDPAQYLGELPEAEDVAPFCGQRIYAFTGAQMRAYALAAVQRALAAQQQAEPTETVEPLKGWKLNHVQYVRGSGTAEIGYLDPEDDRFSPTVTVDTGLYYQPEQAAPLAVAILAMLQDATPPSQQEPGK